MDKTSTYRSNIFNVRMNIAIVRSTLLGEQNMTFGASGCLEEVW
jgi:hypothetical protein